MGRTETCTLDLFSSKGEIEDIYVILGKKRNWGEEGVLNTNFLSQAVVSHEEILEAVLKQFLDSRLIRSPGAF